MIVRWFFTGSEGDIEPLPLVSLGLPFMMLGTGTVTGIMALVVEAILGKFK